MATATQPVILDTTGQRIAQAIENLGVGGIENLAPPYDPESVTGYAVGAVCSNLGEVWKCNTAIPAGGETWNVSHWTQKTISELIAEVTVITDATPTQNSTNPVQSGGVYTALAGKQATLTFDNAPTASSDNPVKSGGIKTYVDNKIQATTTDPGEGETMPSGCDLLIVYEE